MNPRAVPRRAVLLGGLLVACAGMPVKERRLPEGTYTNPAGTETVTVTADEIAFHVVLVGKHAGQVFDRSYRYRLRDDGRIEPYPVREVDAVFGIGNFAWVWDGERILQQERSTGAPLQPFARAGS